MIGPEVANFRNTMKNRVSNILSAISSNVVPRKHGDIEGSGSNSTPPRYDTPRTVPLFEDDDTQLALSFRRNTVDSIPCEQRGSNTWSELQRTMQFPGQASSRTQIEEGGKCELPATPTTRARVADNGAGAAEGHAWPEAQTWASAVLQKHSAGAGPSPSQNLPALFDRMHTPLTHGTEHVDAGQEQDILAEAIRLHKQNSTCVNVGFCDDF